MTTLKQKYYLSNKTFELTDRKVLIVEKSVFDDKEWEARYNELGLDLVKVKSREGIGNVVFFGGLLILTVFLTFKAFTDGTDYKLAFFFLLGCFMWGTVIWWSIQKYFVSQYVLAGGDKILTFFINSPDEKTVKGFIDQIRERTRRRLKDELTHFDPDLSFEDQLNNLKYLKNIDVIDQEEFEKIREQLREKHLIK
ncbi:hypothetical protein [Cyclobacterium sp.]|uniref:hypothetical protein n=1 Tax=Cyclobacterium sp. TaxID=1966343 RepID=UPI00198F02E5|nr:hypothetical protein [Cyclobacterium sp.]MBD3628746.1 hypothetical protein [Cyclobacterium sp.]